MPGTPKLPNPAESSPEPLLSLSEVISALSFAIDLTEGALPGHALRSCVLGMRIAARLCLPQPLANDLYYALLLKDVGCSSNAARVAQIVGGDDRIVKAGMKLEEWTNPRRVSLSSFVLLWRASMPGANPLRRLLRIVKIALHTDRNNMQLVAKRCERGAAIIRKLGFSDTVAAAVQSLDEHWDGRGYPKRLADSLIPLLARILAVAQHLDVFATARSPQVALEVLHERSGRWFDPQIVAVAAALDAEGTLWQGCSVDDHDITLEFVLSLSPAPQPPLAHQEIDRLCEAFADVVDAKSPFTYRHSLGVAEVAYHIARTLGLPQSRWQLVRRSALLHDLGKLSIPNSILDKAGDLSGEERAYLRQHAQLTRQILSRIRPFREIANIAGAHHEKLDGSGYPDHLTASDLPIEARILAVADMYRALTEHRPYRLGLSHAQVMRVLRRDTPQKLDPNVVEALDLAFQTGHLPTPALRRAEDARDRPPV